MKKHLITIVFFLLSSWAVAQDWKEDLKALKSSYGTTASYSATLEYNTYYDSSLVETTAGSIHYHKGSYHTKVREMEIFCDLKKIVTIDHDQKVMLISPSVNSASSTIDFDSISSFVSSVETSHPMKGLTSHRLHLNQGELAWIELTFSSTTKQIISITKKYRDPYYDSDDEAREVMVKVSYSNFKLNPISNQADFNAGKYILLDTTNNSYQLTKAYASYELVSLL